MTGRRLCPTHDHPEPCRTCERLIADREEDAAGGARYPEDGDGGDEFYHYPPGFYDPDLGRLL